MLTSMVCVLCGQKLIVFFCDHNCKGKLTWCAPIRVTSLMGANLHGMNSETQLFIANHMPHSLIGIVLSIYLFMVSN